MEPLFVRIKFLVTPIFELHNLISISAATALKAPSFLNVKLDNVDGEIIVFCGLMLQCY